MALCDGGQASEFTVAIGGTADAEGRAAMTPPTRLTPSRTLADRPCCYTLWFCVRNGVRRKRRASTKADWEKGGTQEMQDESPGDSTPALAATSALALAFAANAGELEKVGMQLILAADVSGSVNSARYKTQQDGYLEALGGFDNFKQPILQKLLLEIG